MHSFQSYPQLIVCSACVLWFGGLSLALNFASYQACIDSAKCLCVGFDASMQCLVHEWTLLSPMAKTLSKMFKKAKYKRATACLWFAWSEDEIHQVKFLVVAQNISAPATCGNGHVRWQSAVAYACLSLPCQRWMQSRLATTADKKYVQAIINHRSGQV